jgi:hypothetical protein
MSAAGVSYNFAMICLTKRRVLHVWVALLAILFSALAPTVSRAVAASYGTPDTVEICTAYGYKVVKRAAGGEQAPASSTAGMDHCAFCAIDGTAHALPHNPSMTLPSSSGRDIYPPLFYAAPHALHAWSAANPRAPPRIA